VLAALRTRGVLIALSVAAVLAAIATSPSGPAPLGHHLPGAPYPAGAPLAWALLTGIVLACAWREVERRPKTTAAMGDANTLMVFGVGLFLVTLATVTWWMDLFGARIHYLGQFAAASFLAGFVVIAAELFRLASRIAARGPAPSAVSALVCVAGVGVGIAALACIAAMASWYPGFSPFPVGMGLCIGLVAIACLVAAWLRLAAPTTMLGLGIGLVLVAVGSAVAAPPRFWGSWRAADLFAFFGFLVLAVTGTCAAVTGHPGAPKDEDRDRSSEAPELPLLR